MNPKLKAALINTVIALLAIAMFFSLWRWTSFRAWSDLFLTLALIAILLSLFDSGADPAERKFLREIAVVLVVLTLLIPFVPKIWSGVRSAGSWTVAKAQSLVSSEEVAAADNTNTNTNGAGKNGNSNNAPNLNGNTNSTVVVLRTDNGNGNTNTNSGNSNKPEVAHTEEFMQGAGELQLLKDGTVKLVFKKSGSYGACMNTSGKRDLQGILDCEGDSRGVDLRGDDVPHDTLLKDLPDSAFVLVIRNLRTNEQCEVPFHAKGS